MVRQIFLFILVFLCLTLAAGAFGVAYSFNTIAITAKLTPGTFIESNLYFPTNGTTFNFGTSNKICPNNNCKYEFVDATFDQSLEGNDRDLSGTLKIQDKSGSNGGFVSFKYYKVLGTMSLTEAKQDPTTGIKIDTYRGDLGLDTKDPIFFPAYRYKSVVIYNENSHLLNLHGLSK